MTAPRPKGGETTTRPMIGRRIAVLGMTAAGKSTLAKQLARLLGVPHIELDSIVHGPNWVDLSDAEFHARTAEALSGDGWIVDGNYLAVRDLTIGQAETVVWLDYPLIIPLWRVVRARCGGSSGRKNSGTATGRRGAAHSSVVTPSSSGF